MSGFSAAEVSAVIAGSVLVLQLVRTAREVASKKEVAFSVALAASEIRGSLEKEKAETAHNMREITAILTKNSSRIDEILVHAIETNGRVTKIESWRIPEKVDVRPSSRIPITKKRKRQCVTGKKRKR